MLCPLRPGQLIKCQPVYKDTFVCAFHGETCPTMINRTYTRMPHIAIIAK